MVSVISPFGKVHEPFLLEAHRSLQAQTYKEFEWVLVPNGGAAVPADILADSRVRVFPFKEPQRGKAFFIGKLKWEACSRSTGEIIVEFDADDILLPTALEKIVQEFQDEKIKFVYSNDCYFENGTWKPRQFNSYWGHRYRSFVYEGHELAEHIAFEPSPRSFRMIYWSPDHVRSWRTSAYWEVGGHDERLMVGDDHDLMCRFYITYGESGFKHIDEALYLYRQHRNQSVVRLNPDIQVQTKKNYGIYIRRMTKRWAEDMGLKLVDLGGRIQPKPGFLTVDALPPADIISDLNTAWPFEDGSVGVINASHVFEHLRDPIFTMNEAFRVLAPGGWLFVEVPSTDGRGAFQDPTHVSFWNQNSFWYFTNEKYARYIRPGFLGRFQVANLTTFFHSDFEIKNNIPVVRADLICLKEPYSSNFIGEKLI